MSEIFFDELEIPPINYHLNIGSASHAQQTAAMLTEIETILVIEKPDWLLIYGDTNSTLAGALAAAKLHIPIAHVEAGLRSYNRSMPEEINRLVADQLSEILFAPTNLSVINLSKEGYCKTRIKKVGDVMYDAALFYEEKAETASSILKRLHLKKKKYVLATIHRAENTDNPENLKNIFLALQRVCKEIPTLCPLHPRTLKMLGQYHADFISKSSIQFIEPVGFLDMIKLEKNAALIVTDSGGIQKEAFFYQVPCVTLRSETEWHETVELGWNRIINPMDAVEISAEILQSVGTIGVKNQFPYGKGNAAKLIAQYLSEGPQ